MCEGEEDSLLITEKLQGSVALNGLFPSLITFWSSKIVLDEMFQ